MSDENTPAKVGGAHAGYLSPEGFMSLGVGAWGVWASILAALAFGLFFFRRGPSLTRTAVKTSAVGLLVVACLLGGAPWPLLAGLTFSTLGDGFLAVESDRRLRLGLACFLLAHLFYVVLFLFFAITQGAHPAALSFAAVPLRRVVAIGVVGLAALAMLGWLWPKLGAMRAAVSLYVVAIVSMVAASLTLPPGYNAPIVGALLFFASDALLAAQLFRGKFQSSLGAFLVWWLYYFGQLGIMMDFAGQLTF
ncbi:MAG: lysoplasmalogenase [Caulobacterales bacterium]